MLNRIRIVLAEKNTRIKTLAEAIGANPVTVSKWCNNKAQPSMGYLYKIAQFLNVTMETLVQPETDNE